MIKKRKRKYRRKKLGFVTLKQISDELDISVGTLRERMKPFRWMFGSLRKRKRLYSPEEREIVLKNVK